MGIASGAGGTPVRFGNSTSLYPSSQSFTFREVELKGDMMRKFFSQGVLLVVIAASVVASGCSQYQGLKAKRSYRDANGLYASSDFKAAAAKYEEVVALPEGTVAQFKMEPAYFFLANCYDNMYRSVKKGDPTNDAFLTKAVEFYNKGAQLDPNPEMKKRALQFLVAIYGPDKLYDPSQQEPLLQKLIEMDPKDPGNYFVLGGIYEQNGDYEKAEQTFIRAKDALPADAAVYTTLAAFYDRQGEFDKVIGALNERAEKEPNNPEAHHTLATYYWQEASKNFRLRDADKRKYIETGLQEADKALALKSDYQDAMTFKNLLLRSLALVETNPAKQQALIKEADALKAKAEEMQKAKAAAPAAAAPTKG